MIRTFLFILPLLFGLLKLTGALATTFVSQPFTKTVQDAPVIVRGKVGMNYSDWGKDPEENKRLYTYYEVQVSETLKGDSSGQSLVIREMGGEKDGVGLHVPGVSEYEKGEDVVVFLKEKNSEGSFDVQGMMMGKYNVQQDSDGKEYLTGAGLSGDADSHAPHTPQKKWLLEDLRRLIRTQSEVNNTQILQKVSSNPPTPPSPSPSQLPATTASAAPSLQNLEPEDPSSGVSFYFGLGLGIVGILTAIWILRRRK